ncbi:MAG TPA: hypothetical protein VF700_08130 [Segetibacter sp.]
MVSTIAGNIVSGNKTLVKMIHLNVSVIALAFVLFSCSKPASSIASKAVPGCYTGKLVKKGICGQDVIELQSTDKKI